MITQIRKSTHLSVGRDYAVWFRTTALIFIQCLLLWSTALASSVGNYFNLPSQYGIVKESFEATSTTQDAKPIIVHIQDAHCNYEAQKNMAQLLEYLVKEYSLRLIMVEGGSGNVSLSFLRSYTDEKARVEVADRYLRMGKISGEEYLDIVSDYDLDLYGIEDEALYDAHMSSFLKVDSIKKEGLSYLEDLSDIIKNLKQFIYSEELRQLEKKSSDYKDKVISLAEYCQYLEEAAGKKGLNLNDYPHLIAFSQTARLEKEIDFQQAETQRNAFIKDLAVLLDEQGVKELINMSQEFKSKRITSQEYYSFLKAAARQRLDLEQNYPYLNSYITYISISKDIDAEDLLEEVSSVENSIKQACFVNTEQRRLNEISKSLQILTRFLNLELTPEDYEYFKANRAKFLTASWIDFLTENSNTYNLPMQPSASNVIDRNLEQLEGFYQLGVEREKAFIKNVVNRVDESGQNLAVLITGGFHTPGVTQMLKDKGYSYIVVAPVITEKSDPNIYFSVLKGEKSHLEKAFEDIE